MIHLINEPGIVMACGLVDRGERLDYGTLVVFQCVLRDEKREGIRRSCEACERVYWQRLTTPGGRCARCGGSGQVPGEWDNATACPQCSQGVRK